MAEVVLDGAAITDWDSFHTQSAEVFGFPEFYGRNMNAWIDCLSYMREGDGMSRFILGPSDVLTVRVTGAEAFRRRAPEVFRAFVESTAAVNERQRNAGERPALELRLV